MQLDNLDTENFLFNKLDFDNNEYKINTYLCCCNCIKASKINYIEKFDNKKEFKCPKCNHVAMSEFGQTLIEGSHIRKVEDNPVYILLDCKEQPLDSFNFKELVFKDHINEGKLLSDIKLSEKFDLAPGSVMKQLGVEVYGDPSPYENYWYHTNAFNNMEVTNNSKFNIHFDCSIPKNIISKRMDSNTQYKLKVSYTIGGILCISDSNLWIYPIKVTRIITKPKHLTNLRSATISEIHFNKDKRPSKMNYPIKDLDSETITVIKDFKNEMINNMDQQSLKLLINSTIYQYEHDKINRLSSKDLALIAFYPNMFYLWKLVDFKEEPTHIWYSLHYLDHKRKVLKKESSENEFLKKYFDVKLSKKERKLISDNPSLLLLYNPFLQKIKNANLRIDILKKANDSADLYDRFAGHSILSYRDDFKKTLWLLKINLKELVPKSKVQYYNDVFLYKMMINNIKSRSDMFYDEFNTHMSYTEILMYIERQIIDLISLIKVFIDKNLKNLLLNIINEFVNNKESFQTFESKLTENILKYNLITSDGNNYNYSENIYSIYSCDINGWQFKLAPSQDYLKYMSKALSNCVGASYHYHSDILKEKSYIVHATKNNEHMCININKNGVLESATKCNKSIETLGLDAFNTLNKYEKRVIEIYEKQLQYN